MTTKRTWMRKAKSNSCKKNIRQSWALYEHPCIFIFYLRSSAKSAISTLKLKWSTTIPESTLRKSRESPKSCKEIPAIDFFEMFDINKIKCNQWNQKQHDHYLNQYFSSIFTLHDTFESCKIFFGVRIILWHLIKNKEND